MDAARAGFGRLARGRTSQHARRVRHPFPLCNVRLSPGVGMNRMRRREASGGLLEKRPVRGVARFASRIYDRAYGTPVPPQSQRNSYVRRRHVRRCKSVIHRVEPHPTFAPSPRRAMPEASSFRSCSLPSSIWERAYLRNPISRRRDAGNGNAASLGANARTSAFQNGVLNRTGKAAPPIVLRHSSGLISLCSVQGSLFVISFPQLPADKSTTTTP